MPLPVFGDLVFVRKKQARTNVSEREVASLIFAAEDNDIESLKMLLFEAKLDPDAEDFDSRTALQAAATYGRRDAVEILLQAGRLLLSFFFDRFCLPTKFRQSTVLVWFGDCNSNEYDSSKVLIVAIATSTVKRRSMSHVCVASNRSFV